MKAEQMTSLDVIKRYYQPDEYDNDIMFLEKIQSTVQPDMHILDAGAGTGEKFRYDLREQVKELVGVDLDPRVESNQRLHRGVKADITSTPFENEYFDIVFSRYVLEHVTEPQKFLKEIWRVLKPGGRFLFLTPNKWHYVCLVSRLSPHSFHGWVNRRRGRNESDTFPTTYRLNSRSDIRREFATAGFVERDLIMRECCPNYLTFALPAFLLGVAYERLGNSTGLLSGLRVNIIGDFEKPRI